MHQFNVKKSGFMFLAVFVVLSVMAQNGFCELSSKAKKAEKLLNAGKMTEAVELYKELSKNKKPELAKEGKDGLAQCLLVQAKEALSKKNYVESKNICESIIKDYPDAACIKDVNQCLGEAVYQAGLISVEKKNISEAELCFDMAVKVLDDKNELFNKAVQELTKVLLIQADEDLINKKYKEAVEKSRKELAKLAKDDPLALQSKSMLVKISDELIKIVDSSIKNEKYEEALKYIEIGSAAGIDENAMAAFKYSTGVCYRMSNQFDKAIAAYKEVINNFKGTPSVALAFNDMYLICIRQGNAQEALNYIKQAVDLLPDNTDFLFKEAQLLKEIGSKDAAQKIYEKLFGMLQIELQKTYINKEGLQYRLGVVYFNLGKYTEAAVEFDKALTRSPNMIEAKKGLAMAQYQDKNFDGAIKTYGVLIKQLSGEFDSLQEKLIKEKDSIELAKKNEDLRKDIAFLHYQNGLAYEQLGNYEKALEECKLGFEGVSTQEAAETLKRIQSLMQKKTEK